MVTDLGTSQAADRRKECVPKPEFRSKVDQFVFDRENLGTVIALYSLLKIFSPS